MSLGLLKGYTRVEAGEEKNPPNEPTFNEANRSEPWQRKAVEWVIPLLLWAVFACSLASLVHVLRLHTANAPSEQASPRASPDYVTHSPPGTLGSNLEQAPLFPEVAENPTVMNVTEHNDRLVFVSPTIVSRYRRFETGSQFAGTLEAVTGPAVHLAYEYEPILRFQPDPAKPLCAIGMITDGPDRPKVTRLGLSNLALMWHLQPTKSTPRRDFLGEIDLTTTAASFTNVFRCPTARQLVVQLECKQWNVCHIDFEQPSSQDVPFGIQLVQWE